MELTLSIKSFGPGPMVLYSMRYIILYEVLLLKYEK